MAMTSMQHLTQQRREASRAHALRDGNANHVGYLDYKLQHACPYPQGSVLAQRWRDGYEQAQGEARLISAAQSIESEARK